MPANGGSPAGPARATASCIANRSGGRTLNVISVDGVNAISGETAGWSQSGYVLDPYESTQIDGWRKNLGQVAAFEFTALPDSYAARTGRPANVGVIGIAVFDERAATGRGTACASMRRSMPRARRARRCRRMPAPSPSPPPAQDAANRTSPEAGASELARSSGSVAKPVDKLGTGHGAIESSRRAMDVHFDRAQTTPNEIVTIHYDRLENLVAMGIVPQRPPSIAADPFPRSGAFVPDPPRR